LVARGSGEINWRRWLGNVPSLSEYGDATTRLARRRSPGNAPCMRIASLLLATMALASCAGPAPWLAERGVVYCYRTLAAPDCYRDPLPGAEDRLIAAAPEVFFTPAAAATE
jgi:hypothetical protein